MDFASRKLCERLQALGCVSESGFVWAKDCHANWIIVFVRDDAEKLSSKFDYTQVFFQNDFTGANHDADEMCQKIWGSDKVTASGNCPNPDLLHNSTLIPAWIYHRHQMIDCHINQRETWCDYLERTMKKGGSL